jgi:hypothetical protein
MYVSTRQPVRQRRSRTLGDWSNPFTWGSPSDYGSTAWYWAKAQNAINWNPWLVNNNAIPTASAPPSNDLLWDAMPFTGGSIIPGSSTSDYLQNAFTGKPTAAQLQYNADQYTAAAANMATVLDSQGVPLPAALDPETAAAQGYSDQAAYTSLIGGTADSSLPSASVTTWALVILGGLVGLMFVTK